MKIYFGHSRDFDYQDELYIPLRASELNSWAEIILPHEKAGGFFNSKEGLKDVDWMVAEVSYPSTGLGIEIGYADIYKIPIIAIYKTGSVISNSVKMLVSHIIEYQTGEELADKIAAVVQGRN